MTPDPKKSRKGGAAFGAISAISHQTYMNGVFFGSQRRAMGTEGFTDSVKIPQISIPMLLYLFFLSICGASFLPLLLSDFPYVEFLSWLVCILSVLTVLFTVRRPILCVMILLPMFSFFSLTGSAIPAALLIGPVISISAGAVLFCVARKGTLILAALTIPISYGCSALLTGNFFTATTALILYLPALALGLSTRYNVKRSITISLSAATLVIPMIAVIAFFIYVRYGALNTEAVSKAGDALSLYYVQMMEEALSTVGKVLSVNDTRALLDEADLLINSSPGMLTASCLVLSLIAHNTQRRILFTLGQKQYFTPEQNKMTASPEAAAIFIGAFILSYTTGASGGISLIAVVGVNLCLMLMPILVILGFDAMQHLIERYFFFGILMAAGLMISTFLLSSLASTSVLNLLALIGAFYVVILHVGQWAKEHFGKGETNE